VQQNNL